jgi:hypothetical protein
MNKLTDKEAEILINAFKDGLEITSLNSKGNSKVISMKKGVCTVKFANGEIDKLEHHFFYKDIIDKNCGKSK